MGKAEKIVISANGENNELIWKVVYKNCIGETDVVVPESRECIIYKDGKMLETFQPGRHTVNVPTYKGVFSKKIVDEPFECKAYFVKKGGVKRVDWGTPNRMKIIDPFCQYPISMGVHGSFNVTVSNSRKFVAKLVGDNSTFDTETLSEELSFAFVNEVKGYLAKAMTTKGIGSYDLDANLPEISKEIESYVRNMFDDYGILVDKFVIASVFIPEEERAELEKILKQKRLNELTETSFKEQRTAEREKEKDINNLVKFAVMSSMTNSFQDCKKNANVVSPVKQSVQSVGTNLTRYCVQCGVRLPANCVFCPNCGRKV